MEIVQGQDPLEALAAAHGAGQAGGSVDPLEALAAQHGAPTERTPDFKQSDTSPNALDPNTIGTFARHLWDGINPLNLARGAASLVPLPKALYGSGKDNPLFHVVDQAMAVKAQADEAWARGDKPAAALRYLDSLIPILGPMMSHWSDELQQGKYAAAAGDMTGFAGASALPLAATKVAGAAADAGAAARASAGRLAAAGGTLTAEEQAANAFAQARGVPLDAATSTGSPFVRGVQKVAGESMLGSPAASRARAATADALGRVGGELAESIRPGAPVSAEGAGQGIVDRIRSTMKDLHDQASKAYGKVRELESKATPDEIPLAPKPVDAIPDWQKQQLRRIAHEFDMNSYSRGQLVKDSLDASDSHYAAGETNPAVYHDMRDAPTGDPGISGRAMQSDIDAYLGGGPETAAVKAAKYVAEQRYRGSAGPGGVSRPMGGTDTLNLPRAAETARQTSEGMQLAVDLREAKDAVRPIYDRLKQENAIAPLQGGKADALRALDRVINGPDHAPLSVAESALGDLKSLARADDPLVRTAGQGIAGKAVQALNDSIELRAAGAGDEVYYGLKEGRAATRAKYDAADVLDQLRTEPVKLFDQMTAPRDGAIDLLRAVQKVAPESMPEIGRAKLEQWLDLATERGGFAHADRLYAEWNKLGAETKRILFGKADNVAALDNFFLLAKRISENPNPSGTAGTYLKSAEVTAPVAAMFSGHPLAALGAISSSVTLGGLAKLLYTPRGAAAVVKLLKATPTAPAAVGASSGRAAIQAAWIDLASAAKAAGVPLEMPKAASSEPKK